MIFPSPPPIPHRGGNNSPLQGGKQIRTKLIVDDFLWFYEKTKNEIKKKINRTNGRIDNQDNNRINNRIRDRISNRTDNRINDQPNNRISNRNTSRSNNRMAALDAESHKSKKQEKNWKLVGHGIGVVLTDLHHVLHARSCKHFLWFPHTPKAP